MALVDLILLLALSAIWGSSFMFMRWLAPRIGPVATADFRVLIAGLFLVALFAIMRFDLKWKERWKRYLVIGLLNSGIPFLLYSFAALSLPSSVEVVLNALSPSFAAIFGAIWLGEKLTVRKAAGIVLGLGGVVLVSGLGTGGSPMASLLAVLACVAATACYGLAGVYLKKRAKDIEPRAIAAASQLFAGIVLLPAVLVSPPSPPVKGATVLVVIVFALLCSAVAYLIYYRLIASIGPTKALTVTFLMPMFGFIWGSVFLGEAISLRMIGGAALILCGTFMVAANLKWRLSGGGA
jgi:drug/metabolite transporter (DMT)-like permease